MITSKSELRTKLKQARVALTPKEHQTASAAIAGRLKQAIDWSNVTTLHCYEPLPSLNEVDISGFISTLRADYPNLKIYTPKQVNNTWQIPNLKFDVIIVPMLGFDPKTLHRTGYGGGYYDKFLATQPQAKKIGVCFEQGKLVQLPVEPHDIPVDIIITDQETYKK
jgi:5-formyltetrahydrofolate cyclo-ligase